MSNKKLINSVGLRLFIFTFIVFYIQFCGAFLMTVFTAGKATLDMNNLSMALVLISVDIIGLPCLAILMKKLPKGETEHEKISFVKFLKFVCISFSSMVVGSILGNLVQLSLINNTYSEVSSLISSSDWIWRILTVAIGAPICEELIFRKLLIDSLVNVGKFFAIFLSALCFGLYHGNLSQFFFAFLLGLVFGYIYVKTGKVIYSILIHCIINTSGSVISVFFLQHSSESGTLLGNMYVVWNIFYYVIAIVGIILLILSIKNIRLNESETALKPFAAIGKSFTSWGFWFFYITCIAMFVITIFTTVGSGKQQVTNDINITYQVNVENNEIVNNSGVDENLNIKISEDGKYVFSLDWLDCKDPGFITGIRLVDSENNIIFAVTGDYASITMNEIYFTTGDYAIEFDFLDDENEYFEFVRKNIEGASDFNENTFENFGKNGEYLMRYHIKTVKVE